MASVFLSYDRDDASKARPLAAALEKVGHSVWWDERISGGSQYAKEIEQALNSADAVVVLWTASSIESPWVRDEAGAGRDRNCLVPLSLDNVPPPLGFRQFHSIDLGSWQGRGKVPQLPNILAAIDRHLTRPHARAQARTPTPGPLRQATGFSGRRIAIAMVGLLIVSLGLLIGRPWEKMSPKLPTVAVSAADQSAAANQLATDVGVKLGSLQASALPNVRLLDNQHGADADWNILVSRTTPTRANVRLLSRDEQAVIWSRQFESAGAQSDGIDEAIAITSGRVLDCLSASKRGRLKATTRRLYLTACTSADEAGWDLAPVISTLRSVTTQAPRFSPAWARLLVAEADMLTNPFTWAEPADHLRAQLKRDLAEARSADAGMPEIRIAELSLNPDLPFADRLAALDRAKSVHPDSAAVSKARSEWLSKVGSVIEAVEDAEHASQIDPFSPAFRAVYIRALTGAGRTEKAREELAVAKHLWRQAPAVLAAEDDIEMRFGDFEKALQRSGTRMDAGIRAYIEARRNNPGNFFKLAGTHRLNTSQKRFVIQALPELNNIDLLYSLAAQWPADRSLRMSTELLFRPWVAPFRRDPRFMAFAKRLGLVAYWQKSGTWPDFCSEPDMPYDCKAEAAKLK